MATKQEALDNILSELSRIEGSEGAAIITRDGMIVASKFDKKYAEDKMAALISQAVSTAVKVINEAKFGSIDTMLIEGTDGKLALISTPNGELLIALVGNRDMNIGMARVSLDDAMEELTKIL